MAERKKLTMYYPPDFDPRLVPRIKRDKNFTCEVRMMLPFSVQCNKCGEFMYMGKKFNSMKENAQGEKFKGIQIIRFYIKCGTCSNQMSFKTDPENDDYVMESGGTRTFETWKESNAVAASNLEERIGEDKDDAMTALENRTKDTQKMVDMLDALDELKAVSQRNERIDSTALLSTVNQARSEARGTELDEADEALVNSITFGHRGTLSGGQGAESVPQGGDDDTFVLEELEQRSMVKDKGAVKKRGKARDGVGNNEQCERDAQSGKPDAAPRDVHTSTQDQPLTAEIESDFGTRLLKQVQENAKAERASSTTALPVMKKRKVTKAPATAGSKKQPKTEKGDDCGGVEGSTSGGLLGLGGYGSGSGSE